MPVVVAVAVDEALIRSSAGRHEAAWMGGAGLGWSAPPVDREGVKRPVVGALMLELDGSARGESTSLFDERTLRLRASVLAEAHLGSNRLRFVVGVGPAVALDHTSLVPTGEAGFSSWSTEPGGRLVLGTDLVVPGAGFGDRWTVGIRVGGFGHPEGVDADLALRTAWAF